MTSAYTLATDFVGVLPIAEGLEIPAVVVSERGWSGLWTTNQISDNTGMAMRHSPTSKSSAYTPPHWPKHIRYLTAQQYHSSVKKDVLEIIRRQQAPDSHQPLKPQPSFVVIRQITGPSDHPASVFRVYKTDRTCSTEAVISTIQTGRGTVWVICGEEDTATNVSAGLSGRSSL